jgi:hypothetical protein
MSHKTVSRRKQLLDGIRAVPAKVLGDRLEPVREKIDGDLNTPQKKCSGFVPILDENPYRSVISES